MITGAAKETGGGGVESLARWPSTTGHQPAPADNPVELVQLTSEDAETAEEPEDAPANVVPMKRGKRPHPQD
jgi:hypothetical protein